jgi:hypothetical protein
MHTSLSKRQKALHRRQGVSRGQVDVDVVRAREFCLVADDGRIRMSMRIDSQGYPRIVMGDPLDSTGTPKARTLKRIVIGFTAEKENPDQVWPRMEVAVRHQDRWCAAGVAVVFREKPGTPDPTVKQVYPQICMHGNGQIRAMLALSPDEDYEPKLALRGKGPSPAHIYTITSQGPRIRQVVRRQRKG